MKRNSIKTVTPYVDRKMVNPSSVVPKRRCTVGRDSIAEEALYQIEQILVAEMAPARCTRLILGVLDGAVVPASGKLHKNTAIDLVAATAECKLALMKEAAQKNSGASFFVLCCLRIAFPEDAMSVFADYKARKAA
ncbi:hypothetical protein KP001_16345 [Geomonas subterranea]|uniref:Uncharacterized protein n=1 Tax=Geomonas subterranea TaxID=2847989 RepID=A0ABX8LD61_9BACT|nr:hypothetical protein [Geomonas subterranea]QXE89976.1 hypothetical protein KP001_16345 [Geomonas subterranea]QXM07904.1 hypothetical protein KP002_12935 [Geomonas subterranea]